VWAEAPVSDADQVLLAGLELRSTGNEGVSGCPIPCRETMECALNGDSGDT
jgi:hypothetical protein